MQSRLAGVNRLFVGLRDASFELRKTEWLDLDSLPVECTESWTPETCFAFLRDVVNFLRTEAPLNEPVVLQKRRAGKQITPNNTYRGQLALTPDTSQQGGVSTAVLMQAELFTVACSASWLRLAKTRLSFIREPTLTHIPLPMRLLAQTKLESSGRLPRAQEVAPS